MKGERVAFPTSKRDHRADGFGRCETTVNNIHGNVTGRNHKTGETSKLGYLLQSSRHGQRQFTGSHSGCETNLASIKAPSYRILAL